jgi:hypothetical protein
MPNFGVVALIVLGLLSVVIGIGYPEAVAPDNQPEQMYLAGP